MDQKQADMIIAKISATYPTFDLTKDRVKVWREFMSQIDFGLAIKRLNTHIATSKFPPSIADILNPESANRKRQQPESETQSVHAILYGGFEVYDPEKH